MKKIKLGFVNSLICVVLRLVQDIITFFFIRNSQEEMKILYTEYLFQMLYALISKQQQI